MIVHFLAYGMTACLKPGPPRDWPEPDHRWSPYWDEINCPACLMGREIINTFVVAEDGKWITCLRCQRTSYNLDDVANLYCGACSAFHEDIWPPARLHWIMNPLPQ